MASFFGLLSHRNRPVEAIFTATDIAEENRLHECQAATKIQSAMRMRTHRKRFNYVRQCVIDMQRVYRGYRGRLDALSRANELAEAHQVAVCNYYAALIQSRFRGYLSRKWTADFYAQKKYIMQVTERSEQVRREANEAYEHQRQEQERNNADTLVGEYQSALSNKHHLLSTASVSGVYRPALSLAGQGTIFNSNVEDDLRALPIQRRKFKPDLPAKASSAGASVKRSTVKRLPLDNPVGPTLLTSAPYNSADEDKKLVNAVNKRLANSIHKKDFVARKPLPPAPEKTLAIDGPYMSPLSMRNTRR